MFKHILMPVDDSPASRKALQRTIAFAAEIGARLTAYHALPPRRPVYGEGYRFPQASSVRAEIKAARARFLEGGEREARSAGVPFEAVVDRAATPEDGILQAARRSKCDAIFMGTNGRRGLARVALGSVASRVIAASPVPVLVYRQRMQELRTRFPAITACHIAIAPLPSGEAEAHVDILLPQHQIIFNEVAPDADAARAKALTSAVARLTELAKRDPRVLKS